MTFTSFLFGTALLAATLATTTVSAGEPEGSLAPHELPVASAADPPATPAQPGTRTETGVPPVPERGPSKSLGIDLKIGGNGFKLAGRLSGSKGVSEAWVNGQMRGDGMTLDGRLKGNDGPARDFTLNLDLLPGWVGTAARLWRMLP